jgi:LacI family transcriptional regulator
VSKLPEVAVLVETSLAAGRDILTGISNYLRQHGPWRVYMEPHHIDKPPPAWFQDWKGDGIIVRMHDAQIARAVEGKQIPVIDVLGVYNPGRYPLVHTDNAAIGRMAADHLRGKGFGHFAFFGVSDENWSTERHAAFAARLREFGFPCASMAWAKRYGRRTLLSKRVERLAGWLRTFDLPLAVFACDDVRALLVRDAIRAAGKTVGTDVALLGVGNDRFLCDLSTPALSSIDADHQGVGFAAAAMLDALMKGQGVEKRSLLIPPREVVVRESSDFLAVPDEALRRALDFIRGHATKGIGVTDVVKVCHSSRSVLQRRFRRHLDQSIHDAIVREQAQRAVRLIRETNDSIEKIAAHTGFAYV